MSALLVGSHIRGHASIRTRAVALVHVTLVTSNSRYYIFVISDMSALLVGSHIRGHASNRTRAVALCHVALVTSNSRSYILVYFRYVSFVSRKSYSWTCINQNKSCGISSRGTSN